MGFKSVMGKIGKVALKAAPIVAGFIPGVGPLASMAIGAGTSALSNKLEGGNLKSSLLAGAMGGASGYLGGKTKGLSPSSKILSAGLAAPGIIAGMSGSGQQQQAAPQQQQRGGMQRGGGASMGARSMGQGMGQMGSSMGRRMGTGSRMGGGLGPSQGFDPYYNASLPGTRAGMNFNTEGPSFGDDPSGIANRMNPTMNPDMPFSQRGTTGGYIDGVGVTIGSGRSITPAQYQAQIAQAKQAGIPDSWIQGYLQANPGDSNRLLEGYASEDGGRYAGQMQQAMQIPWQQFEGQETGMPAYNPMNPGGGGGIYQPQYGGGGRMMMGRRSATQGRMGPSMAASYGN